MQSHNLDELRSFVERHEGFAEFFPLAAQCAAEKGHDLLDSYHCFAALLRHFAPIPMVRAAMGGHEPKTLDDALWTVVKTEPPIEAVVGIAPLFWVMLHSTLADAYRISWGRPQTMLAMLMYFIACPPNVPYRAYEELGIDRKKVIRDVVQASGVPQSASWLVEYYERMHKVHRAVTERKIADARRIEPGEGGSGKQPPE